MNAALNRQASEIIPNPSVLINLISRRVRQLNGGGTSRPLADGSGNLSAADMALREIIEGKMIWEMPEFVPPSRPNGRNRNRPKHWTST